MRPRAADKLLPVRSLAYRRRGDATVSTIHFLRQQCEASERLCPLHRDVIDPARLAQCRSKARRHLFVEQQERRPRRPS